jgi:hypothetical protein
VKTNQAPTEIPIVCASEHPKCRETTQQNRGTVIEVISVATIVDS